MIFSFDMFPSLKYSIIKFLHLTNTQKNHAFDQNAKTI
jgi:hypothetical protein